MVDFAFPADNSVKIKESIKKDNYLDLARELKNKLCNMKVTVIPIVIGTLGRVIKGLIQGLKDLGIRDERRPSTALLRWTRILRIVPGT